MAGALAKKMLAVMAAVDAVEKRGKNEKQGYGYVKAVDVAREVRRALVEIGIAFDYSAESTERWEKQTNAGGTLFFVELKVIATFTDLESGESKSVKGIGWGMDSGDKAIYKAMTGALKYCLRMTYLIPDELDPENDTGERPARQEVVRASSKPKQIAAENESQDPIFDETGEPLQEKSPRTHAQRQSVNSGHISAKQVARFWALALKGKKTKPEINSAISAAGIGSIEECPWGETYDNLCEWAQS